MNKHSATVCKDNVVQTLTFEPTKMTPEQAKEWMREQGFEIIDFTEASPEPTEAGPGSGGKRDGDRGPDQTASKPLRRTWKGVTK